MKTPKEISQLQSTLLEHLEAAVLIANELGHGTVEYLIEDAINKIRTTMWPADS